MAKFGGQPYFEGAITSNSTLLSQPSGLASSLGSGKGSSGSSRSSNSDTDKIPKGSFGETLSYILEGNALEHEKQNIKMDMIKEIQSAGGPTPDVIMNVQKKYADKLSQITRYESQHKAAFNEIEVRGKRINDTASELSKKGNMYADDGYGNLIPTKRQNESGETVDDYMLNYELGSELSGASRANDRFIDHRPIDLVGMEEVTNKLLAGAKITFNKINLADRTIIMEAAARGEDLHSDKYASVLERAVNESGDNMNALLAGVESIKRVLAPGTDESRAFNYAFNIADINRTDEQKAEKIFNSKTGKEEPITKEQRKNEFFNKFLNDKVTYAYTNIQGQDKGYFDRLSKAKSDSEKRSNSRLVNIITGGGQDGFTRKSDSFFIKASGKVDDDAYRSLFGSDGAYRKEGEDAVSFLMGEYAESAGGVEAKKASQLNEIRTTYNAKIEELRKNGYDEEAKSVTKAFQAEYFKVIDPGRYAIFNTFGKIVENKADLKKIYMGLKDEAILKKQKDEEETGKSVGKRITSSVEGQLALNVANLVLEKATQFGITSPETLKSFRDFQIVYSKIDSDDVNYISENGLLHTPLQWLAQRQGYKESTLAPNESAQLHVQKIGVYENDFGQSEGEIAGVRFEAAGSQVLKVHSIIDDYKYNDVLLDEYLRKTKPDGTPNVSNGSKFLKADLLLSLEEVKNIVPSKDLEKFDPKKVVFIDGAAALTQEKSDLFPSASSYKGLFGGMDEVYEKLGFIKLTDEEKLIIGKQRGSPLGKGDYYVAKNVFLPYGAILRKTDVENATKEPANQADQEDEGTSTIYTKK